MNSKFFEIKNTLDAEEYRLITDVMSRTIYHIALLEENLDNPLSFLQISYLSMPDILRVAGKSTYQISGRLGTKSSIDFPEDVYSNLGIAYLTPEQFDKGIKQASDELKERFDVIKRGGKYRLAHKLSQLTYSMGPEKSFPSVVEVSTIPTYRGIQQTMIKIDTENVLDIIETLANQLIAASDAEFNPAQLETYRPSEKYPISRRQRFK